MQIIFRVDASPAIGSGHVMRCLALAQAWRHGGGSAIFVSAEITPALEARITGEGFKNVRLNVKPGSTEDAARTGEITKRENAAWIVADSYYFGQNYQRNIKASGPRLLLLDDYGHAEHYSADLVLNQNLSAREGVYRNREPHTRLLLGTRYVLLREEFLVYRNWRREIPAVGRKVLVTLGGGDFENVTSKIIQALSGLTEIETVIVAGGSNPHLGILKTGIRNSKSKMRLAVDSTQMPELMAWADVAIAGGGSTSWELAYMGLPSLIFTLADNQQKITLALQSEGISVILGQPDQAGLQSLVTHLRAILSRRDGRSQMSLMGRRLVDGWGSARVAELLVENATLDSNEPSVPRQPLSFGILKPLA